MTYSWLSSNIVLGIPFTTFPDLFKNEADETPDKTACIFIDFDNERSVLTFVEFLQQGNNVCKKTSLDGSKERWHLGLSRGNVPEWLIADLDVQITGGCSLCLPYQLKEEILVELLDVIATVIFLIIDSGVGEQKYRIIQNILKHDSTSD